jgi:serine/threonine protein kinase
MKMEFWFQNAHILFFVMKYMKGGELRELLTEKKKFSENVVKFYAV